jgi:Ca-activated chloride channel family protein
MNFLGVHFVNSEYLVWGAAILFVAALMMRTKVWRSHLIQKLGFREGEAFAAPRYRPLKNLLYLGGLALLWVALLGPQWGQKEMVLTESGLDLCIAIDISKSMMAEDLRPNRLEAVKNQLPLFFNQLAGDRVAVTAFAGSGFIASPLTSDYSALTSIVEPLQPDFISDQSTHLAVGIETCLSALKLDNIKDRNEIEGSSSKVILLVTDGGSTSDEESAPLEQAKSLGVPIFVVAAGTAQGAMIPVRDEYGIQYLKDPRNPNEPVVSKLDDKSLAKIAENTNGKVYYASAGNQAWISFKKALDNFERSSKESGAKRNLEDRFQIPLLLAFLALFIDLILSETRLFLLAFLLLGAGQARAVSLDEGWDQAQTFFETRSGINRFKEQKYDQSVKHFESALQFSNQDWAPRYNWATGKIYLSIPKDAAEVKSRSKDPPRTLLEAERELEGLLQDLPPEQTLPRKIAKYQMAWIKWIKGERIQALKYFYESLRSSSQKDLDEATKNNITLLLFQMAQSGSGGDGDKQDGKGGGEDQDKNQKVQQGQGEKPKFTGTDIDENQAGKILQSVGAKELETLKKESRGEAKDRDVERKGDKQGKASGKDPQW